MAEIDSEGFIGSVGRTAAAVLSGVLIARGLPPELVASIMDPATAVIIGSLGYFVTQTHSLWSKWIAKKKSSITVLKIDSSGMVSGGVTTEATQIEKISKE
jgi:hypothetical protein